MKFWTSCSSNLSLFTKRVKRSKDKERPEKSKQYLEESLLETTTPLSKLRKLLDLPMGIDQNEWIASHAIAMFDHVNLIYGTISECCTTSTCPEMTGPGKRIFYWTDEKGKKIKLPANTHIDYVMTFIQNTVNDESIFPTKYDQEFPTDFESTVKRMLQLMYQVLAHIYHAHFREIVLLNLHPHLNSLFSHLILLGDEFKLLEAKDLSPLEDLAVALGLIAPPPPPPTPIISPSTPTPPPTSSSPTPPSHQQSLTDDDMEMEQSQFEQGQSSQKQRHHMKHMIHDHPRRCVTPVILVNDNHEDRNCAAPGQLQQQDFEDLSREKKQHHNEQRVVNGIQNSTVEMSNSNVIFTSSSSASSSSTSSRDSSSVSSCLATSNHYQHKRDSSSDRENGIPATATDSSPSQSQHHHQQQQQQQRRSWSAKLFPSSSESSIPVALETRGSNGFVTINTKSKGSVQNDNIMGRFSAFLDQRLPFFGSTGSKSSFETVTSPLAHNGTATALALKSP